MGAVFSRYQPDSQLSLLESLAGAEGLLVTKVGVQVRSSGFGGHPKPRS